MTALSRVTLASAGLSCFVSGHKTFDYHDDDDDDK